MSALINLSKITLGNYGASMVDTCETSAARIKPASKSVLLVWVIKAAKLVEN